MTAAKDQPKDRRVQRTRRTLREALIALLTERGWDEIGVQEICERADVGRSTFYMHFQNKEQLLAYSLGDLRALLRAHAAADGATPGRLSFLRGLIEHVREQRKLFRSVVGRRSGHVVQMRFKEMVIQLVEDDLGRTAAAGWQREAGARYVAGALFETLAWWVDARAAPPADEIESFVQRISETVVAQLPKGGARGGG